MVRSANIVGTLGWAIDAMKGGEHVTRLNWNGKGQYLSLQVPDEISKMSLPYIFITTVQGYRVPWLASQTDMLADDWVLVESAAEADTDAGYSAVAQSDEQAQQARYTRQTALELAINTTKGDKSVSAETILQLANDYYKFLA